MYILKTSEFWVLALEKIITKTLKKKNVKRLLNLAAVLLRNRSAVQL